MTTPQLAIHCLRLVVEAPRGVAERAALDATRMLRAGLQRRLAVRFAEAESDDEPVLLIRRMEVSVSHAAASPLDVLADRLADAIAAGVAKAEAVRSGALFFPSRVAYTAAFVDAMLAGSAWDHWWFRGFAGVRALPPSAAIRTILSRDWQSAAAVLGACNRQRRSSLWAAFAPEDAEIILSALAAGPVGTPHSAAWAAIADAVLDVAQLHPAVAALAIVVETASTLQSRDIGWLVPIARRIAAMSDRILSSKNATGRHAAHAPALPPPLSEAIAQALAARTRDGGVPRLDRWRASPLLGFALLLPVAIDLPIDAMGKDWPEPASQPAPRPADLVRLLLLSACAGSEAALWRDPVWRDLYRVPGSFGEPEIVAWSRSIPARAWRTLSTLAPAAAVRPLPLPRALIPGRMARGVLGRIAARLMLTLAERLPGFGSASPAFLRANILGSGGSALIARETVRIRLNRPPLDILLGMTPLASREIKLSDGRRLSLERAS